MHRDHRARRRLHDVGLDTYFSNLGVAPAPTVSSVSVDHASNTPTGSADGPDGEVMLDIEVAGAVAPKAKIVVYFTPNTSQGFLDAITHAVHDTVNKPSVISISWGGPESGWTAQAFQQFNQAFQAAAALGITVCVAAGDNGSSDGVDDGQCARRFPGVQPQRARVRRHQVKRQHDGNIQRGRLERARRAAPPVVASAMPSRCRTTRRPPAFLLRRIRARTSAEACLTWLPTPTPPPATRCASTAKTR